MCMHVHSHHVLVVASALIVGISIKNKKKEECYYLLIGRRIPCQISKGEVG